MEESITDERPHDLIRARMAAKMAGKGLATIRLWVRKGKLTGYRHDPVNPRSPLMVSEEELRIYLHTSAKATHTLNRGRPPIPSASVSQMKKEKEKAEKDLSHVQTQFEHSRAFIDRLEKDLDREQSINSELRAQNADLLKQIENLHMEKDQLRIEKEQLRIEKEQLLSYCAQPWWRRVRSPLLLTG